MDHLEDGEEGFYKGEGGSSYEQMNSQAMELYLSFRDCFSCPLFFDTCEM